MTYGDCIVLLNVDSNRSSPNLIVFEVYFYGPPQRPLRWFLGVISGSINTTKVHLNDRYHYYQFNLQTLLKPHETCFGTKTHSQG